MRTFTTTEAAVVTGETLRRVQKLIDEGPIRRRTARSRRRLGLADLLYLALSSELGRDLTPGARQKVYAALKCAWANSDDELESVEVTDRLVVRCSETVAELRQGLARLSAANQGVVSDPDILGGEPVLAGTRVPVFAVTDMLRQGATEEELLEGYPTLTPESLEHARIYAAAYPKRGRPKRPAWR